MYVIACFSYRLSYKYHNKMDSLDLLAREDEFKKLNKQLEKKTESLMKEIEQAMVGFVVAIF